MGNGNELKSHCAKALRLAGYKPAPRLWLTDEQMELLVYMALQNQKAVNRIRGEANRIDNLPEDQRREAEIDFAWKLQKGDFNA